MVWNGVQSLIKDFKLKGNKYSEYLKTSERSLYDTNIMQTVNCSPSFRGFKKKNQKLEKWVLPEFI